MYRACLIVTLFFMLFNCSLFTHGHKALNYQVAQEEEIPDSLKPTLKELVVEPKERLLGLPPLITEIKIIISLIFKH